MISVLENAEQSSGIMTKKLPPRMTMKLLVHVRVDKSTTNTFTFFCMRKHFHLIGHFLKNAQSSENMYEIFFGPLKNAQLSENACP